MKLTSLGVFLILVGALALCPLLRPHMMEGFGFRGRPHRAGRASSGSGGGASARAYGAGSYDAVRRANMAPAPASGAPPPQAEVTGNGYQVSASSSLGASVPQEAPGTGAPQGIPGQQIAPGDEDLYILKSQVVPPVCPACPIQTACPRQEPCPPCPPCARCPEPAFECQKVPNYKTNNSQYLPRPVLTDFSQFGM